MSYSDEKLMEDVTESESGYIEVYIRFNKDFEKDYCFQLKTSETFKDLNKIFTSLPIALRPNLFCASVPIGYEISTSPGYLTEDGSLLFDYDTETPRYVKSVSLSDKVADKVWPGQLILPKWETNYFNLYSVVAALLVWLYTDLPDFISPTPGICMTNQVSRYAAKLALHFGQDKLASALLSEIIEPVSITAQCVFFVCHILKLVFIFLVLWSGAFNPISMRIPFISAPVKDIKEVTKEDLMALGWTGSKRASPEEYKDFYRDYKIKEHGGLVEAHKAGVFETLQRLGVFLGDGEGFNTPLDNKTTMKGLLEEDNEKFTMNYEYLAHLGQFFELYCEGENIRINDLIKQFRRYGVLHSSATIRKIVDQRKALGDAKI